MKAEGSEVWLREVMQEDLEIFFTHQQDSDANHMAAFTAEDPTDHAAFLDKWSKLLQNDTIIKRTILVEGKPAGHIVKFVQIDEPAISYWIGREFWGRGVATRALALFLDLVRERPLYALAAKDNIASIRVLQKNGFRIIGEGKGYAHARGADVEEYILKLD